MCLLSFYPTGVEVDPEALRVGADSNPDGFGFAVMDLKRDRIKIRKSMKPDQLIEQFVKARKRHIDAPALFHCRLTTDGMTGKLNNHPFVVTNPHDPSDNRTIMAHNGIFPSEARPRKGDIRSDTRIVAETMAGSRWDLRTSMGRLAFGEWMGSYSKVAILTLDPAYASRAFLINGHLGNWDEGVWHSNTSYKWSRTLKSDWRYVGGSWYQESAREYHRPSYMYQDCDLCAAQGTVHTLTLFCSGCGACNECWVMARDCRCAPYWKELESGSDWGREDQQRESITVDTVARHLAQLDAVADELDDSMVGDDGTIVWPKVLGPGPMVNGWPEDSADPTDGGDDQLRRELEVLVAHVNNGGDI